MSEEASDGSPPRPVGRRIRKVMVVSSTSESESEGSVITSGTRRKRLRVLSDDGSDSSGSAVVAPRRRTLRALRDSDADSEQSDTGSQQSSSGHPKPTTSTNNKTSGFSSDSSEGNSEKCAICLLRFKDQEVGIPETCEHIFCLDCITEWSKNVNTCPVDRMSFNSITVRTCAGGRVLRTEPVQSRPLFEVIVFDDAVHCQVCGNPDNEATMLLCDGCDQGFHMHCLNPPLRAIPLEEWLCPNCDALMDTITTSELHNVIDNIMDVAELDFDEEIPPFRSGFLSEHISLRRSNRDSANADEPSTSSGRGGPTEGAPSTSRGSRGPSTSQASRGPRPPRGPPTRRRTTAAHTRKRRKPRTVIIEYELQTNGKFPITKTVKRKVKKRKSRRKPRTAARRAHVRASVRARLATLQQDSRVDRSQVSTAPEGVSQLSASRRSAGIPALSLFGDNELEYFSEDEHDVSEGGTAAVAARPSAGIFSAYRQARRKMISIPSPPHTSSAPDLVSSIMESQNLLHNKRSVVTISVDGKVDIKLESRNKREEKQPEKESRDNTRGDPSKDLAGSGRVDLSKSEGVTRKAPSYPGQGRSGGWGGGYRGNYHRDNPTGNFSRAYEYGAPGPRAPAPAAPYQHQDEDGQYNRRGSHYADDHYERPRRQERSQPHQAHQGRYSGGPGRPWQANQSNQSNQSSQYFGSHSGRHSFGGFDNPLDMRMPAGAFPRTQEEPASFQPLPEPPTFNFDKPDDKEDDRSDPELIIDTEKYDPTEPTNDDESGDDEGQEESPEALEAPPVLPAPALASPAPPVLPRAPTPPAVAAVAALSAPPLVQNILANFDTGSINVPANVLDDAVRQVLQEHRDLMMPRTSDRSDDDSDGDCPNFSIYSATSVHIAELPREPLPQRPVEVMPDDYPPPPDFSPGESANSTEDADVVEPLETPIVPEVKDRNQELKEKISKRCPITVSPRNPIKIKLNTPTLIRRHVSLYDEEDIAEEEPEPEPEVEKKSLDGSPEKRKESPVKETAPVEEKEPVAEEPETEDAGASPPKTPDEELEQNDDTPGTPTRDEANYSEVNGDVNDGRDDKDDEDDADKVAADEKYEDATEDENDVSDSELMPESAENGTDRVDEVVEKMTESISETEDERSYTPCLDENKSKDTSLETEKEKVLEGLDTEMISEEEADIFSDEGEEIKRESDGDDPKKKKKKESKKEKSKGKSKKSEVTFKKISKSGKERNYRERDKDDKKKKDRRESGSAERRQRRRERRKDLERYDVRSVVGDKRRAVKDAFGRDVSPHRSPSAPRPADRRSGTPRLRRSQTPRRKSISPRRKSISPRRRSISPRRRSISPRRRSLTPRRRSATPRRKSITPRRKSITPRRKSISPRRKSLTPRRKSLTPRRKSLTPRRKSISPRRKSSPRRRRSGSRASRPRKRARRSPSPKPKAKKKKRARSEAREGREPRKAGKRKRAKRASPSPVVAPPAGGEWSGASVDSRLLSPCTPPPRHRRSLGHPRHKRTKDLAGPSKEVFTSGDNILVSVSFKDQDRQPSKRKRKGLKRAKRLRRRAPSAQAVASKPVAIIDLERSPFREITPSPKNVIVLSDSDRGAEEGSPTAARGAAAAPGAPEPAPHAPHVPHVPHAPHPAHPAHAPHAPHAAHAASSVGPKTPPEPQQPQVKFALVSKPTPTRPNPLRSPQSAAAADVYDPFQPTRSASASPASRASPASPAAEAPLGPPGPPAEAPGPRAITLETAQKTNMSADDVIDRRPLSPIEKVMALLQSTRDVSPEPPPNSGAAGADAPPPRIVLPSPTRPTAPPPKLFLAKPSPIKSNPVKPMQATKISRLPLPTARQASPYGDSPYSPGSSDFGDLFSPPGLPAAPPGPRGKRDGFDALFDKPFKKKKGAAAKVPVKLSRKKGKMQVGVKIDEDNLKILDDLPSSAVEMQVKSKFLKKLNRQERVVEEVKLVLKPHYNKKHVTKDEYKDVLRRCVPKICHNKSGEINPAKIQALVEAYVKKIRKKHKLGLA